MSYKIIDVEGIGEIYAKKLTDAGINNVEDLWRSAQSRQVVRNLQRRPTSVLSSFLHGPIMLTSCVLTVWDHSSQNYLRLPALTQ